MRRNGLLLTLAMAGVVALAGTIQAANHVSIDRIQVEPNATGVTIGVYVENDLPITGFVLPLEIRTWSGGAYMVAGGFVRGLNSSGRMNNSPLGAESPDGFWPAANATLRTYATAVEPAVNSCNRKIVDDMGNRWNTAAAQPDFISPDAIMHAVVSTGDPSIGEEIAMAPGSDPPGTPSYRIVMNIGPNQGVFIIDTTCVAPANHLVYAYADTDSTTAAIFPTFEHGIVGVGVPAGVRELETGAIPQSYSLEQNYPNPFNAGTVIRFQQPVDGNVRIDVYNILGHRVRTLVDEFRSAGTHQADWDGRSEDGVAVATGVYFYRITAETFTSTRKMVLLK